MNKKTKSPKQTTKTPKQTTKTPKKTNKKPKKTTNKKGGNNISKNLLENKNINFKISSSK